MSDTHDTNGHASRGIDPQTDCPICKAMLFEDLAETLKQANQAIKYIADSSQEANTRRNLSLLSTVICAALDRAGR